MSFDNTKKNWEGLAKKDPLWAICTNPAKKKGKWNADDFFESGKKEIEILLEYLSAKNIPMKNNMKILDFGCGVGRLGRALYPFVQEIVGIDVSESMVNRATEMNRDFQDKLHFIHNAKSDLGLFDDQFFDVIITGIVLQHISYPENLNYIREFIRVAKAGGILIFQVPVADKRKLSLLQKVKSKIKIRERLALLGIGEGFQMEMNIISEEEIRHLFKVNNVELVDVQYTNHTDPCFDGALKFLSKEEADKYGFVSRLFIARKS